MIGLELKETICRRIMASYDKYCLKGEAHRMAMHKAVLDFCDTALEDVSAGAQIPVEDLPDLSSNDDMMAYNRGLKYRSVKAISELLMGTDYKGQPLSEHEGIYLQVSNIVNQNVKYHNVTTTVVRLDKI